MKVEINIDSIMVITNKGNTDKVFLHTDLPYTMHPYNIGLKLTIQFDVEEGKGVDYCKKNFPNVPIETIER